MENKPKCITDINGTKKWFINGVLHREDGPAIEMVGGTKKWFINDKCHRIDNPAIEWCDGSKSWYLNDKRHRLDGPAYSCYNGEKYWLINDYNVTDKITQWAEENDIDLDNLTEDDKLLIKLVWADYDE